MSGRDVPVAVLGLLALVAIGWERIEGIRWDRLDRGNVSPLVKVSMCVALFLGVVLVTGR